MIWLYSGTPGSGKSYHLALDIVESLKYKKKPIIANFPIDTDQVRALPFPAFWKMAKKEPPALKGKFFYCQNDRMTPALLRRFSRMYLPRGRESSALLIIDECAVMFNCRNWQVKDRSDWIKFFQLHRKLGYDILLVSQTDRLIDRQVRAFCEYEVKHRNARNFKLFGKLMSLFFGGSCFIAIEFWYGCSERIRSRFLRFRKSVAKIYDTYQIFE